MENLSSSELGTCCVLNRVAEIINMDTSKLKGKEKQKIIETQKELRQKYCKTKKKELTKEEKESVGNLYKQLGLWKGE